MSPRKAYSERGFAFFPRLMDNLGSHFKVYEASAAREPCIWLKIDGGSSLQDHDTLLLNEQQAEELIAEIRDLFKNHYQKDDNVD
jgi:hypothetical protein